jgi:light-regulated signal transduction histidine kinase (bacteriophytochrome)
MRGVNSTEFSSLSQISEWEIEGSRLDDGASSRLRNSMLNVSIQRADGENSGLQSFRWSDEGLPIVKRIVHMHQGLIDITSHQGKGTTVDLFFPL